MSWNYRILHRLMPNAPRGAGWESCFGIHEVYYNEETGAPEMCSMEPISLHGETMEELQADMDAMKKAFEKPVLEYSIFCKK